MSEEATDNRNRANSGNSNGSISRGGGGSNNESPLTILAGDETEQEEEEENSICANSLNDESSSTVVVVVGAQNVNKKNEEQITMTDSSNTEQQGERNPQYPAASEASFLGTFGSPGGKDGNNGDSSATNNVVIDTIKIVSWTETLQTPAALGAAIFLPSSSTSTSTATTNSIMMDPSNSNSNSKQTMESCCRHGLGLQIAVDRTHHVNKQNRKCITLLLDVTTAYDHFASQLIKAGQALQPAIQIIAQQQQQQRQQQSLINSKSPNILALQEAMVSWSGEVSILSAVVRTGIAQPLQTFFATTHADATTAVYNRYSTSRQNCVLLRQRTATVRNRHARLVREVEMLLLADESKKQLQQQVKKSTSWTNDEAEQQREAQATTGGSSSSSGNAAGAGTLAAGTCAPAAALASSKRLIGKLREVRRTEIKYKRLVQWEADCVSTCQRLEHMALETLQNMEEDRLYLFVFSLLKTLASCKLALDKLVLALREHQAQPHNQAQQAQHQHESTSPDRSSISTLATAPAGSTTGSALGNNDIGSSSFDTGMAAGESRNRTMSFVKMLTLSTSSGHGGVGGSFSEPDETAAGAGCMDAETLGLPVEIGKLRDETRAKLTTRRERVQVAKILSVFLDTVAKASTKLGNALMHRHHRKESGSSGSNKNAAVPVDSTNSCEGARAARLWNGLLSFIETEADGSLAFAESLRSLRSAKLDALVAEKEKAVKAAFDADDANWKQLCEAARAHLKAESRYRQSSAESAKARVRVNSLDNEKNKQQPNNLKVGKHVSKGLANMFSILPDGGEAMRSILPAHARASVAQLGLEEADQKEAKERLQFDETLEVKSLASTAYRANAESLIAQCDEEIKAGLGHCCCVVESSIQSLQSLLTERLESLGRVKGTIGESSKDYYFTDINEWRASTQKELDTLLADSQASKINGNSPDSLQRPAWLSAEMARNNLEDEELVHEDNSTNEDDGEEDDFDMSNGNDDEMPLTTEVPPQAQESNDPFDVQKLFSSFAQPNSPLAFRKIGVKKLLRRKHDDPETAILLDYFWPDVHLIDVKKVTAVVGSFSCSFRSASEGYPVHYGRVYLSPSRIIFTSWTKKKRNYTWQEIIEVKTSVGLSKRGEDTLVVTYQSKGACMVLGGISDHQAAFDLIEKLREDSKSLAAASTATLTPAPSSSSAAVAGPSTGDVTTVVPPDGTLQKMELCVSKHLRKISIQRYWELIWSDKGFPDSFYAKWLAKASMDIEMQAWKEGEFVGPWDNEKYGSERVVRFRVKRKTHLYIGPPIANVVQTHRCRVEGNDRCVLSMTVEFEGIPYADTFAVEIRWVATREGVNDIKMECGVFVNFKKSTFLKKQIQSGTIEESMPAHKSLFQTIQEACVAAGGEKAPEEEEKVEAAVVVEAGVKDRAAILGALQYDIEGNCLYIAAFGGLILLFLFWRSLQSGNITVHGDFSLLNQRVALLEDKIDAVQGTLNEVLILLREQRV